MLLLTPQGRFLPPEIKVLCFYFYEKNSSTNSDKLRQKSTYIILPVCGRTLLIVTSCSLSFISYHYCLICCQYQSKTLSFHMIKWFSKNLTKYRVKDEQETTRSWRIKTIKTLVTYIDIGIIISVNVGTFCKNQLLIKINCCLL